NPQGGAATSGPTAMLNSLARFDARYHAGSVQNIKFTPRMFNHDRKKVKVLFDTYFRRGGCQLMVTVCDRGQLEDAQVHPERYPDLIVRVAGYSAVFVDLPRDVQDEVISRTLWDE
ncbi:MAG: formate C-acetyltransferase, partial [Atopobiaceae bacterium]|nr:formate C-acetyltransferase [Atopobiaceae bacterium]